MMINDNGLLFGPPCIYMWPPYSDLSNWPSTYTRNCICRVCTNI